MSNLHPQFKKAKNTTEHDTSEKKIRCHLAKH